MGIRSQDLLDSILPLHSRLTFSRTYGDQCCWANVGCRSVSNDAIRRPLCCRRRDGVTDDQRNLFTSRGAQGEPPLGRCRPLLRLSSNKILVKFLIPSRSEVKVAATPILGYASGYGYPGSWVGQDQPIPIPTSTYTHVFL